LCHSLDAEGFRHNRKKREMVVQMLFGERDIFDGYRPPAAFKLNEFVYPYPSHFLATEDTEKKF
jgi:hypothetical protein